MLMKLSPRANFINILCAHFMFKSFFKAKLSGREKLLNRLSYKKCAHKMLMQFTAEKLYLNSSVEIKQTLSFISYDIFCLHLNTLFNISVQKLEMSRTKIKKPLLLQSLTKAATPVAITVQDFCPGSAISNWTTPDDDIATFSVSAPNTCKTDCFSL